MILSDSQEKAEAKLKEIAESIDEDILIRNKDYIKTSTKTIEARSFSKYCRGYRYQYVYIDYSLKDTQAIELIVMKLVPPDYYIGVPYDENYNWRDYVSYF